MIDDQRELGMAFRDASKFTRLPRAQEHDGEPGFLGCWPEPVGGAIREPCGGGADVTRTPSIPGCSFHLGRSAADSGFFNGMRPITAKRLGYRLAASIP